MEKYVLALDQGTTSSRAILFDAAGVVRGVAQQEVPQLYPQPGWVEHDPRDLWTTQLDVASRVLSDNHVPSSSIAAIGITNQRETTLLWDRGTGKPVANAIVWQDRRTSAQCAALRAAGLEALFRQRTGLPIDPYFSGTKLQWLLDNVSGVRARAEHGELAFGTVDSYLMWRLSEGAIHATDVSNASRTLLFDIRLAEWDEELLEILGIPRSLLPVVRPSSHVYGETAATIFGAPIPIAGVAGDQQAATFGQACHTPGMVKNTYGTGSFLLMNTGSVPRFSEHGLLTTVAWQLDFPGAAPAEARITGMAGPGSNAVYARSSSTSDGRPGSTALCYGLEGSVFVTGAAVQWLRDELQIIDSSADIEALAASTPDSGGVVFVPAFTGLGTPYWDPYARGAILGLTRGVGRAHIARAALEAVCFHTADVVEAMQADAGLPLRELRVDGGMTANNMLLQMQADTLGVPVVRPTITETTALGAAFLAGLAVGFWRDLPQIAQLWKADRVFEPGLDGARREEMLAGWRRAVARTRDWATD